MTRDSCGSCRGPLELILDLGTSPLADAFPTDPNTLETRYPLQLFACTSCSLVQLGEVVPDEILWSDYGFYSSASPAVVEYHRHLASLLLDRHFEQAHRLTVEIACNDGSLLSRMTGCRVVGVDPAEGPANVARDLGLDVKVAPFGGSEADEIRDTYGPAGLVVASNVAAHVADLPDFLCAIRSVLAPDGVAVIEVQSLADLLQGNQFDHVYHEHRYYFSIRSLTATLRMAGLHVIRIEHTPMQGGSIRLTCQPMTAAPMYFDLPERGLFASFSGLQARADYMRARLRSLLFDETKEGRKLAGYAASAKSTTLLNWCGIGPDVLSHVVDTTPHKIGRFTPGTHIPIVGPRERPDPDTYLLLAWNYLSRIRKEPFAGRWIVPIPQPVVIP